MKWMAWGILLLHAVACRPLPPSIGEPGSRAEDSADERAYQEVLDRYTARAEIYSALNTRLFTAATYQSWPFREARVRRTGRFWVQPPEVVEQRLAEERTKHAEAYEYYLGVWVSDSKFDDFDKKSTIWRIALVTDNWESTPVEVRRLGRSDVNIRSLYPYMGDFWVGYSVRFPKVLEDGRTLEPTSQRTWILRLASTLGKADLVIAPPTDG